ncbi:hypothetical protein NDU88_006589 [Pleurodeles waltl]|uniref:Uncharacterized protein n=1 Tax=Pleurodeles waltl TaxID=8319 RepID=A0AAV7LR95_PLEWA|nr:hypothetical protein NDU88_006589 [Pleurodeles waltl]
MFKLSSPTFWAQTVISRCFSGSLFSNKREDRAGGQTTELVVFRGDSLSIYQRVSTHTVARRREFQDVTLHLRERKIVYQWGFSLCPHFTYQDKPVAAQTLVEAGEALGLSPPRDSEDSPGPAMPSLVD